MQVKQPKPKLDLVENEKKEIAVPEEAQRVTTPAEIKEKGHIETQALKNVQSEWTCAVCQLTTKSEAALNSHLQGKKHRSKCENLKTNAQTKMSNSEETKTTSRQTLNDSKKSAAAKANLKNSVPGERTEKLNWQQMQGVGKPKQKKALVQKQQQQPKYGCSICNITCPGHIDLACHRKGKKHLQNLQSRISSLGGIPG